MQSSASPAHPEMPDRPDGAGRLLEARRHDLLLQLAETADQQASTERDVARTFRTMAEADGPRVPEYRRLAEEAGRCADAAEERARQLRAEVGD